MSRKPIPADPIDILSRVNAELSRRNGNGDLSANSGITFDVTPVTGGFIRQEHYKKNYDALKLINSTTIPAIDFERINLEDIETLETFIALYESQPRGATTNNDCASACSGMCITLCTTSCGGSCSGTCSGSCTGGCSGCGGSCSYNCTSCSGTCTGSCTGSCTSSCTGTCSGGCTNNCQGCGPCTGCYTGCTGCKGTCTGSCTGTCKNSCVGANSAGTV